MEIGETTEEAAARETKEEALADVEITALYAVLSMPHIGQVYMVFRGRMLTPEFGAGTESLEVRLFPRHAIPWEGMAFPVVAEALRCYVKDAVGGQFPLHLASVDDRMPPEPVPDL
jgi:ADP-ribose pyrophosphatase YjhB (NUDIX family)